jgi:glyceraldehyde 3-phosphate dehydrogenase (phosphorylating)
VPIRVGLMGLGRIGRNLFRILYPRSDIELALVADVAEPTQIEYLLRFDTILGRFPDELRWREGNFYVAGKRIPLHHEKAASGDVPWDEHGVDIVVEATARSRTRAELERHLARGASGVILCAPPRERPDATILIGVNEDRLRPGDRIVSNGSCTAHAAAPVIRVLHEAFGIERAFLSTVHAYTNQQRLADVPAEDLRSGRAAAENIIPQTTNAAHVIEELLPELAGRITAMAMNVPVPNGSVVDLVCWHEREVTRTAIHEIVRSAAATARLKSVLEFEEDPIVSADIARSPYSGTFDAEATMVLGNRVSKTLTWYDNGWGYAHRVVDLIRRMTEVRGGAS